MKDIYYEGDLSKDIESIDNDFNFWKSMGINFLIKIVAFTIMGIIALKLNILTSTSIVKYIVLCTVIGTTTTIGETIHNKYKHISDVSTANKNINSLVNTLNENGLSTSKDKIIDAEITEEITNSRTKGNDGKLVSKRKKIIEYFYLLDNEDQIKVLKQIKNEVIKNKEKISVISMQMLEEEDLRKIEIPVRKTLVLRNDD